MSSQLLGSGLVLTVARGKLESHIVVTTVRASHIIDHSHVANQNGHSRIIAPP